MKKEKNTEKSLDTAAPAVSEKTDNKKEKNTAKITKVGAMLKEMRQQKGVKLSDVSKILCIRKFYLEAIETSDYETVPPFPYGIGFIRSYAKFLGLNSENIVELYKEETNTSTSKDMRVLEPQSEASLPGMKYLIISVLAIVLIYAGWTAFNSEDEIVSDENVAEQFDVSENSGVIVVEEFNFDQTETGETVSGEADENMIEPTETSNAVQVSTSEEKITDAAAAAEPAKSDKPVKELKEISTDLEADSTKKETPLKAETAKPVIPAKGVFVEILKETWVEAKDETKLYLSKVLQAGETYKFPEKKGMILSVGKDDGVNVYINGVLTQVVRPNKRMNIALDTFLDADH